MPFRPPLPHVLCRLHAFNTQHYPPRHVASSSVLPPSGRLSLNGLRPWVNGIYPSHDLCPTYLCPPSLFGYRMPLHNNSSASPGFYEIQRLLWQVFFGVSEGWLQGLPWQVLPLSRSVVKEWLASAALSSFAGITHSVSRAAAHSIGAPVSNWVLDSGLCQGWLEGAMGTLDIQK